MFVANRGSKNNHGRSRCKNKPNDAPNRIVCLFCYYASRPNWNELWILGQVQWLAKKLDTSRGIKNSVQFGTLDKSGATATPEKVTT